MKTSIYAAAGIFATVWTVQATPTLTAQQHITMLDPEDFVYNLGGPEPDASVEGFQSRVVSLGVLPALAGQGVSMVLFNVDACAINLPHIHPRATEMLYLIKGNNLRVAFVEENGGEGAVVNDISTGDVTFFPESLIHYQQNLDCEPATYLSALNNEDPGTVTITTRFFELPTEAIQDPELTALIDSLPEAPAAARLECLKKCGMDDSGN